MLNSMITVCKKVSFIDVGSSFQLLCTELLGIDISILSYLNIFFLSSFTINVGITLKFILHQILTHHKMHQQ